ncbi:MAG: hypothetical protein DRR00_08765 [Candidatus Parabeggiatoa sp. nov. 3]|nr:MAG: hypothetical protein DRR00_08765 [Gammaproteobacteria bacterium]RKZ68517.1 MAG: hypothetical protein DRQ99_03565 [Gammaproteobacteria bacterium]
MQMRSGRIPKKRLIINCTLAKINFAFQEQSRKINFALQSGRKINFALQSGRKINFALQSGRKINFALK